MELFASNEAVAALENALSQSEGAARLPALIELAWQLRQRDSRRSMTLVEEAERLLSTGPVEDTESMRSSARLALVRAESEWLMADLEVAERRAVSAQGVFERLGDSIGSGDAKWLLASIAHDLGQRPRRSELLESAREDFRAGGDLVRVDMATARFWHHAAFRDARAAAGQLALAFDAEEGHAPSIAAWVASAWGMIAGFTGDMGASVKHFLQAYRAALASGQVMHAILSATNGADEFANLGDLDAALEWDELALELARNTGRPNMMANPLFQTGNVLRLLGRHAEAKAALTEALSMTKAFTRSNRHALTLFYFGELSLDEDDLTGALDHFRNAEEVALVQEEVVLRLSCRRGQASVLCRLGRTEEALALASSVLEEAKAIGNAEEEIRILRVLAELHHQFTLPPPEGMTEPSAELHYLNGALSVAGRISGYTLSHELLDEVARAHATCGDFRRAYENAIAAAAARDSSRLEDARNRAMALHVRRETGRAHAEAEHHRLVAQNEAKRAADLQESITTLETLGQIGRRITANLDLDVTLESLYAVINEIIDAPSLGIAVVDAENTRLDYRLVMIQGERKDPFSAALDTDTFGSWCVKHQRDILIDDVDLERGRYLKSLPSVRYGSDDKSLVFVPLSVGGKITGVLTVQSPKRSAYDRRAVETIRAVGAYIAVAIENAKLFQRAIDSERSLRQEHTALLNAQAELKQLCGIIPICASCKKIRDDGGSWHQLESYIKDHSEAEFTHGICPDCSVKLYGDLQQKKRR